MLVQPRKTRPYITEILLMVRKESNQASWPIAQSVVSPIAEPEDAPGPRLIIKYFLWVILLLLVVSYMTQSNGYHLVKLAQEKKFG